MNYTVKKYNHISKEERFYIQKSLENRMSMRFISRKLNRNVSTISREIKKNSGSYNEYEFEEANNKSKFRHRHKYMFRFTVNFKYKEFTEVFKKKYDKKFFGIKATYNFIKENYQINKPSLRTIFNGIKSNNGDLRKKDRLRGIYKKGGKRQASVLKRLVSSAEYVFPIGTRPKRIDLRQEYGHGEADLILGKRATGYKNILTLTERMTRVGFAIFVSSKAPFEINSKLCELIKINDLHVESITVDNGIEFEKIGILAKKLDIKIYRAEPYASFQRGSNENGNGMIRREFKKGFNFNLITTNELNEIVRKINEMPREILSGKSSLELFKIENAKINK